ncbi:MAG: serine protease, partial [Acidobacteriota bacterium]|nr:serine protease [Acidobacteriota bacterium]
MSRQLEHVRRSTKNSKEAIEKVWEKYREGAPDKSEAALNVARGNADLESLGGNDVPQFGILEAIILAELRPAYFVTDDLINLNDSPVAEDADLVAAIRDNKANLERIGKSIGRVDLFNHWNLSYAGTGWLIDDGIAVTNRHVARVFAETDWAGRYRFKRGVFNETMEARIDYVRQHDTDGRRRRADVLEVLYIASSQEADIAFLRVEPEGDVEPLELFEGIASEGLPVAAVGYPAEDPKRNDPVIMAKLFGDTYDVKRFAPGYVTGTEDNGIIVTSDYSSLGGNSGSPVIDLETGKAVALHFAGAFKDSNYAVSSDIVAAARKRVKTLITVVVPTEDPSSAITDRDGYSPEFLGTGDLSVPLPSLGPWGSDVAAV